MNLLILILISITLFFSSCSFAPFSVSRKLSSDDERSELLQIKERLRGLLLDWDKDEPYTDEVNKKYSVQVFPMVRRVFELQGVKFFEPREGSFVISYAKENQTASDMNKMAYSYFHHMGRVRLVYDPLFLYEQNFGGVFLPENARLLLSNDAITNESDAAAWITGNELHESVHAKVQDLQLRKIWSPFWGSLTSDSDVKPWVTPYDHNIYFDELMAYYKQLSYLMDNSVKPRLLQADYFKRLNVYYHVARLLSLSTEKTLSLFKGFEKDVIFVRDGESIQRPSSHTQIYFYSSEIGEHIVIYRGGFSLDLILDYKRFSSRQEKVSFALQHIQKLRSLVSPLNQVFEAIGEKVNARNFVKAEALLATKRDLISFDTDKIR